MEWIGIREWIECAIRVGELQMRMTDSRTRGDERSTEQNYNYGVED